MTRLQRFLLLFIPRSQRAAAEAESRAWHLTCTACGNARSVWALGGIRWKASGNPVSRQTCPACNQFTQHRMEKRPAE